MGAPIDLSSYIWPEASRGRTSGNYSSYKISKDIIAGGVISAFLPNGANFYDVARSKIITCAAPSYPFPWINQKGISVACDNSGATAVFADVNVSNLTSCTWIIRAQQWNTGRAVSWLWASTGDGRVGLQITNTGTINFNIKTGSYDTTTTRSYPIPAGVVAPDIVIVWNGGYDVRCFMEGAEVVSTSSVDGTAITTLHADTVAGGAQWLPAIDWSAGAALCFGARLGYALPASQARQLSMNVMQFFEPVPLPFPAAAATGIPTLSTPQAIVIGQTTAQPQVTLTF